jgi:hypothetical protein
MTKNKFEGFCYVCGDVVLEMQGIAEQRPRIPGEAGWGKTQWSVRHKTCKSESETQHHPLSGTNK